MSDAEIERLAAPYESHYENDETGEKEVLGWWFDNTEQLVAFAHAVIAAAKEASMSTSAHEQILEALLVAEKFMAIACDWNIDEAEINGEMRSTYDWLEVVRAAITAAKEQA